jgi:hypothetical protein
MNEFFKSSRKGWQRYCKNCSIKYNKKYRRANNYTKLRYQKNKEQLKKKAKEFRLNNIDKVKEYKKNYYKRFPWAKVLESARQRCNNKNNSHYKWYGERGIKCYLTLPQIKFPWFRDKAWLLKQPSIDRIDNDGNYELKNCRFIELGENSRRARKGE